MSNIKAATGKKELIVANGKTIDIQKVILSVSKDGIWRDTKEFSKDFNPTYNGLWALWRWVKNNIQYIEDPDGVQWIKDPSRLYEDGSGDCKSFTLFIVSVLQNLKVPYSIRFTSYLKGSKRVTHVYPVAHLNGKTVILDAVWYAFDSEKKYTYKEDFNFKISGAMTKIYRLSGVDTQPKIKTTDVLVTAKEIEAAAQNIPDSYLNNDITNMTQAEFARFMGFKISGAIGASSEKKAFTMPILANEGAKVGSVLSKVTDAIKNAWKKVVNWIFKTGLKLCAPYFLYTFISKKVGKKTDARKAKQDKVLAWASSVTGTPIENFKLSIAAGIKEKTGKTPSDLLKALTNNKIGEPVTIAMTLISVFSDPKIMDAIKTVISKIVSVFKKEAPAIETDGGSKPDELATEAAENSSDDITQPLPSQPAEKQPIPNPEKIPDIPTGMTKPIPKATEGGNSKTDNEKGGDSSSGLLIAAAVAVAVIASK